MNIVGISAFYHDSAACLIQDGRIIAAAQEERFSRKKHDESFPISALSYCLRQGAVAPGDLDLVVFYDKPLTKFMRILRTHFHTAPYSLRSFLRAVPTWSREKLWVPYIIEKTCRDLGYGRPKRTFFTEHHESHAASAFFPSPFAEAAILTLDGAGEWATTTIGSGSGNQVTLQSELRFPHSLGLLYSAFTYFTGFRINSGEYKLMGLAPYGEPTYADRIRTHLIDLREDGSFRLDMSYFNYLGGLTMTNEKFHQLFEGPPRKPEAEITRREMDLARSIQEVTEEIVIKLARFAKRKTGAKNLCMAGGVALNCVANGKILEATGFDDLWIQPAAGDAGGALGAALYAWYQYLNHPREVETGKDSMAGARLGPQFGNEEIQAFLDAHNLPYRRLKEEEWAQTIARLIAEQHVVGLFQGRLEFGPRALGGRSILGDPRSPKMQSVMNLKIKYRESFRPFAPSVLQERVADYFMLDRGSPYMLLVAPVREEHRVHADRGERVHSLRDWVNEVRSSVPAITHVDYSARIQTVSREVSPHFYGLIQAFEELTGCGLVVNTSFNVRGEPIVCTPDEAYQCFMRTQMDYLVLESFLLAKEDQTVLVNDTDWTKEFVLD
ncbi:MAG: carbamoyltransferase [Candidatus Tectomicrobia bacterium]|uniref:Carbamoyltransferase n=1 Tax=Tectimicrobiota bacterium TaxID=2528274 RepID=A0A932CNY4_UNCTE|nr:carbamoyltransferase [Candidatus Tectomicrobia bacterium]